MHPDNAQGEYYLTDVVEVLAEAGHQVVSLVAEDPPRPPGVNDRAQLAAAEAGLRARTNREWLARASRWSIPATTYIDTTVTLAADVTIFPGAILQGRTAIGQGVEIGPGCRLVDCTVGEHTTLEHTVARLSEIGADCAVGPVRGARGRARSSRPGPAPGRSTLRARRRVSTTDPPTSTRRGGAPWSWSPRRS